MQLFTLLMNSSNVHVKVSTCIQQIFGGSSFWNSLFTDLLKVFLEESKPGLVWNETICKFFRNHSGWLYSNIRM